MYLDKSPQQHSSQRGSDIHIVEVQAYCLHMELASLLKVIFGLALLVSQSLMQQALHRPEEDKDYQPKDIMDIDDGASLRKGKGKAKVPELEEQEGPTQCGACAGCGSR